MSQLIGMTIYKYQILVYIYTIALPLVPNDKRSIFLHSKSGLNSDCCFSKICSLISVFPELLDIWIYSFPKGIGVKWKTNNFNKQQKKSILLSDCKSFGKRCRKLTNWREYRLRILRSKRYFKKFFWGIYNFMVLLNLILKGPTTTIQRKYKNTLCTRMPYCYEQQKAITNKQYEP